MMLGLRVISRSVIGAALFLSAPTMAEASLWEDATMVTLGVTDTWSNKVELADINGDGRVDILFANGRGYASDDGPEVNSAFINQGPGMPFVDIGEELFGEADSTRVIKARDVDGDGNVDLFVGNTWGTRSRLFLGEGDVAFEEVTASHLPEIDGNIGDAELGDLDGDGDLDLVLAEWGAGNPAQNEGGVTRIWLNDGLGVFSEAAMGQMPAVAVGWSWELELADVDNDYDLDIAVSCKSCTGSFLFLNDGAGVFSDASDKLPQFPNNYDFEFLDIDGDSNVDTLTINDRQPGNREHLFIGDGAGGFADETEERWPDSDNPAGDDNMIAFLDVDSDGDPDVLLAGLFGQADRLLINDGAGYLSLADDAFSPADSPGTLGIAVADLDGDKRPDVVLAEGEAADPDYVLLGVDIAPDSAPPVIDRVEQLGASEGEGLTIRAVIHDNKTPLADYDLTSVLLRYTLEGAPDEVAMRWYGGLLWRAQLPSLAAGSLLYQVCAVDAAGNEACSAELRTTITPGATTDSDGTGGETEGPSSTGTTAATGTAGGDTGETGETGETGDSASATSGATEGTGATDGDSVGCGCSEGRGGAGWLVGVLGALGVGRRRRASAQ